MALSEPQCSGQGGEGEGQDGVGGVGDEVDLQVRMHTEVPLYGLLGWHQPSLQGEPSGSPSKHQC